MCVHQAMGRSERRLFLQIFFFFIIKKKLWRLQTGLKLIKLINLSKLQCGSFINLWWLITYEARELSTKKHMYFACFCLLSSINRIWNKPETLFDKHIKWQASLQHNPLVSFIRVSGLWGRLITSKMKYVCACASRHSPITKMNMICVKIIF